MQVERLPVFWKQRRMMFFDAFSFAFPAALQRVPYSLFVSLIWTVVTYFPVGLAGEPDRYRPTPCCSLYRMCLFCLELCLAQMQCDGVVLPTSQALCQIHKGMCPAHVTNCARRLLYGASSCLLTFSSWVVQYMPAILTFVYP